LCESLPPPHVDVPVTDEDLSPNANVVDGSTGTGGTVHHLHAEDLIVGSPELGTPTLTVS
jgi:hypothetical protein